MTRFPHCAVPGETSLPTACRHEATGPIALGTVDDKAGPEGDRAADSPTPLGARTSWPRCGAALVGVLWKTSIGTAVIAKVAINDAKNAQANSAAAR